MSDKQSFSSRIGFLASAAGSALGLGSLWLFPQAVAENGGGGFLLLFLLFTALLGVPLLIGELAFGRHRQQGLHASFAPFPAWHWLGGLMAAMALIIYSFYNLVTSWLLPYIWGMVTGSLFEVTDYAAHFQAIKEDIPGSLLLTGLLFLTVAVVNQAGVSKGIEQVSRWMMPLFFMILLLLVGYSLTLKGAGKGVSFYLLPTKAVFSKHALLAAISMSFMSLSVACGAMPAYGAYSSKHDYLPGSALLIAGSTTVASVLAGLLIFPFIYSAGISAETGEKLAFISLPLFFQQMGGWVGTILGIGFFLLLFFAAFTSTISLLESAASYTADCCGWSRRKAIWVVSLVAYLLCTGSILGCAGRQPFANLLFGLSFMDLLKQLSIGICMPVIACCFCFFLAHQWRLGNLYAEVFPAREREGWKARLLGWSISYVAPGLILLAIVLKGWAVIWPA